MIGDFAVGEDLGHDLLHRRPGAKLIDQFVDGDGHRVERLQLCPELFQIPLFGVDIRQFVGGDSRDGLFDKVMDLVGDIVTLQIWRRSS